MRRAAGIAAFAAVCLAAGCSGSSGHAPSTDPSRSVPSTPVTSPSTPPSTPTAPATPTVPADVPTTGPNVNGPNERPPVEPIVATQHTAAGAKAFAEFFIRTIDWAYATNSTKYMRHYYETSCVACGSAADAIDRAGGKGHHFIGDRFTISRSVAGPTRGTQPSVIVHFDITAAEVVDQHDRPVNAAPAQTDYQEHIYVAWRNSGWVVVEMIPKAP